MIETESSPGTTLVVLLGGSHWPKWKELKRRKSFQNSAHAIRGYFYDQKGYGLPQKNLLDLFDSEADPNAIDIQLSNFLKERIASFKKAGFPAKELIVYYVGHAGFERGSSDYYLTIVNSRPENRSVSSIRVVSLAKTIRENARSLRCYLILDCCFSGSAVSYLQAEPSEIARKKTTDAFCKYPNRGTALLSSSAHDNTSEAPPRRPYTMFSAALLRALKEGDARRTERLSIQDIGDLTWDFIEEEYGERGVRPEVHTPDQRQGDVARVPLFPNLAGGILSKTENVNEAIKLFEEAEGVTQCYVLLCESEQNLKSVESIAAIARKALVKYVKKIEGVTKEKTQAEPCAVKVTDVMDSPESFENAVRALCRAGIVVFDVTNYEPAIMLLMGIRSVARRGITICSGGGDYVIGDPIDFPFNIKEVNIVSHSVRQIRVDDPIDIFGKKIVAGFSQLKTFSNYLDLPTFDAIRNLPLEPESRKTRNIQEQVLVLCPFDEDYVNNNWTLHLKRNLDTYLPPVEDETKKREIVRTLDMKSPRLVSQSLYEAIRLTEMCVVDWTGWRPNVFFEFGVRLAASWIGPVCIIEHRSKTDISSASYHK